MRGDPHRPWLVVLPPGAMRRHARPWRAPHPAWGGYTVAVRKSQARTRERTSVGLTGLVR